VSPRSRWGGRDGGAWLVPNGAVTGVGSLPIDSPSEALEFVATYAPLIPFCPQPPAADLLADTVGQQLESTWRTTDRRLEDFARAVAAGAFPSALALKSQITGPLTLAGLLQADHRDLDPDLFPDLARHVAARAAQQARQLMSFGLPVLITVDEPALVLMGPDESPRVLALYSEIFNRIRAAGARTGLHCCATTHPSALGFLDCDVMSFDASEDSAPTRDDVGVLNEPERLMAFGLVGVSPLPDSAGKAFSRWLTASALVSDPFSLASRTVVTPRCGLGRSSLAEAEVTFRLVAAVGELVRQFGIH
jgi:methionine synthase II (cobalamin-independent)